MVVATLASRKCNDQFFLDSALFVGIIAGSSRHNLPNTVMTRSPYQGAVGFVGLKF